MNIAFFQYLISYIFKARSRQNLLVFAFFGLLFSSFSLLTIQSLMGGLQNGVVTRSKSIEGELIISLKDSFHPSSLAKLESELNHFQSIYSKELEVELHINKNGRVLPAIVHGISQQTIPTFLAVKKINNFIIPYDFAFRMDLENGDTFSLISPSERIHSLSDIPRMGTGIVERFISTDVPEIDQINIWTRLRFLQNFLHRKEINKIRVYKSSDSKELIYNINSQFADSVTVDTWEKIHRDLAWALNLESKMMLGLFLSVIFLVSISIISGQLIFWSKIKQDLVGMWLLGASSAKIFKAALSSFFTLNLFATALGIVLSYLALQVFSLYGGNILPDIFIDRKVPILIESSALLISFVLPLMISTFFCWYTLKVLMKDTNFLELVRTP